MIVLKAISLIGFLLCVVLMIRKQNILKASDAKDPDTGLTFSETWARGLEKKNLIATIIIGLVANFFDTL